MLFSNSSSRCSPVGDRLQRDLVRPVRVAAKNALNLGALVVELRPPAARSTCQEHQADRPRPPLRPGSESLGQRPDLLLAPFGVVDDDQQPLVVAERNELVERLLPLSHRALHLLVDALEKTRHPAEPAKIGCHLDHEPRLAHSTRAVNQATGDHSLRRLAPLEQLRLCTGGVDKRYDRVLGLQQLRWADRLGIDRK